MDKSQIGLAGEYYVLAQLAQRGLVGALTMGHTKGIDILVSDSKYRTLYRIEVKSSAQAPRHENLFGKSAFYAWTMGEKHETIRDDNLYYCFVHLGATPNEMPKFFIVPSRKVATYVRWEHRHWRNTRTRKVEKTTLRRFRIPVHDPDGYFMNWSVFEKPRKR